MCNLPRRTFLKLASAAALASQARFLLAKAPNDSGYDYVLTAVASSMNLHGKTYQQGLAFNGQYPAPVLRAKQGGRLRVKLVNKLSQATTIHWHGVRLENSMDGVPFLTQKPVMPGESFLYDFRTPDAGTFWYHPHIHSVEQLSKGLTGVLIVEETDIPKFDQDILVQLKNFQSNPSGQLQKIWSMKKAGRAGTVGRIPTVNGKATEQIVVEPGDNIRLRLVNLDNTKIYQLSGMGSLGGRLLAVDSNPLAEPYQISQYDLGPGARIDIGLKVPKIKPGSYLIYEGRGSRQRPIISMTVRPSKKSWQPDVVTLPPNPVALPQLDQATRLKFLFEWSGAMTPMDRPDGVPAFWAMNRRSWEGFASGKKPEPLATLKLGKSYIFEFSNETPHRHPIHLHGLFFRVDWSSKKKVIPYFADTVLMDKNEKVRVSLVADNPGDWMFHCHIIEHMKTGFMGYIRVES